VNLRSDPDPGSHQPATAFSSPFFSRFRQRNDNLQLHVPQLCGAISGVQRGERMIEPISNKLLRVGHAALREYKGFTAAHLLVLARMAASSGAWLSTNDVSVSTLTSARYARQLLDELTTWNLLEDREINRRGDREFKLSLREFQKVWSLLHNANAPEIIARQGPTRE
jgi:hypothetical protein